MRPSSTGIVAVSSTGEEAPVTPVVGKRPRGRPRKTATSASDELKPEEDISEVPAKRARSRRSTVDIADEEPAPTPAPKKRGRPSKKVKEAAAADEEGDVKMEDIQEAASQPPPPKQRRKSAKPQAPVHVPEEPVEATRAVPATAPAAVRKPRTSFMPPPKLEEQMTPQRPRRSSNVADDSSPFSDYNPFQAGSAEAAEVVRRRRKVSPAVRLTLTTVFPWPRRGEASSSAPERVDSHIAALCFHSPQGRPLEREPPFSSTPQGCVRR